VSERYVCIHGHFYQPPRENPWLEAVEIQDSAHPYHDWNERITAECYAPNAASRILDGQGRIREIVSNYARISFNIGPTLMSWFEANSHDVYDAIIEADRLSIQWRSGHGAAMAQCYNHAIMPLANARDKAMQVEWGMADFARRFMRDPEGMWLPETAVDVETLEVLAAGGIRYTVLAPHQAGQMRLGADDAWEDVSGGQIDPARPYLCRLPSGREIALFFYDGPISQAVAFEGLLKSGETFAARLMSGFSDKREFPQLVHIATDGESYGHHHRFGDMALAYALNHIDQGQQARMTNYGEFLALHPPTAEARVIERSSWSCVHGVERWRSDCGCNSGGHRGWNQRWRGPLREGLDQLRDEVNEAFEQGAASLLPAPWAARNAYINVILDRSNGALAEFIEAHGAPGLMEDEDALLKARSLMELQRNMQLMYTSCAWFFDDISGIETLQIMQYAARVIQLARETLGLELEAGFMGYLGLARSNHAPHGWAEPPTGAEIYARLIKPHVVSLPMVLAHYAISSLYTADLGEETALHSYAVKSLDYTHLPAGRTGMVVGLTEVASTVTGQRATMSFGLLHLGGHDFTCGVRPYQGRQEYDRVKQELTQTFERGRFAELVRSIDRVFGPERYTLGSIFRDEQRRVLDTIIKETLDSFEDSYRRMFEDNRILMSFLQETETPLHQAFLTAARYTLNLDLRRLLESEGELDEARKVIEEIKRWDVELDHVELEFAFRRTLERQMHRLFDDPYEIEVLENMARLADMTLAMPFELNLWLLQNLYFRLVTTVCRGRLTGPPEGHDRERWDTAFRSLGMKLNFNLDAVIEGCGP
jgi:alpha-amylase/alpha-mannosidase (GH57 family)